MMKKTTKKQFECLVELMENNLDIARGLCKGNKDDAKNRWINFAIELNMLGPPIRDGIGWLKVWTDFKFNIKKKFTENKSESTSNGCGTNKIISFITPIEKSVIGILNLNTLFSAPANESDTDISFRDAPACPNLEDIKVEEEEKKEVDMNIPSWSQPTPYSRTPGKRKADIATSERLSQLIEQTEMQEELAEYTKNIYHLKKDNLECKREMLRLMKEKNEMYRAEIKHKQKYREDRVKIERERLMLQKQRLGLEKRL